MVRAASAAGGDGHTLLIKTQQDLEHLAFQALETQAKVAGQPFDRMANQLSMWHGHSEACKDPFPQPYQLSGFLFHFFPCQGSRCSEAYDPCHVFGG